MELLKNYWKKVWGNKITGICAGVPFATTAYFAFDTVFASIWLHILVVAVAFIVAYNIAIFFGGETLAQIEERWAKAKLTKTELATKKAIDNKVKELAKQSAKQSQERLYAQAKTIVEQESKAKIQKAE